MGKVSGHLKDVESDWEGMEEMRKVPSHRSPVVHFDPQVGLPHTNSHAKGIVSREGEGQERLPIQHRTYSTINRTDIDVHKLWIKDSSRSIAIYIVEVEFNVYLAVMLHCLYTHSYLYIGHRVI